MPKMTTIGVNAFKNTIKVAYDGNKSLKLPKAVTIGTSAFENCTGLKAVQLNQNSVLKTIGDRAFYGCTAIEDIFLPSSLDKAETNSGYIGSYAFAECLHLTDVISEANQLSDHIFYNDNSLTNLTLSTNVTEIPDYAFYGCTKYADAEQCPNVTKIGVASFYKVTFFSFDLHGCTSLGDLAFSESTIRSINLRNVETIGASAFAKCEHLESISIPATVDSVGASTFADCEEMTTVTFGVDEFNEYMFSGCESLSSVTFKSPSTISTIPAGMFKNCSSLATLAILSGNAAGESTALTNIGAYAFYNTAFPAMSLTKNQNTIGACAFAKMQALTTVNINVDMIS